MIPILYYFIIQKILSSNKSSWTQLLNFCFKQVHTVINQGSWDGLGPPSSGVRLRPRTAVPVPRPLFEIILIKKPSKQKTEIMLISTPKNNLYYGTSITRSWKIVKILELAISFFPDTDLEQNWMGALKLIGIYSQRLTHFLKILEIFKMSPKI